MKRLWFIPIVILLIFVVSLPIVYTKFETQSVSPADNFLFGVTFGSNSTKDAKVLIDKVKGYTNLFVIDSWPISQNESALTEVCDYAAQANLKFMVYFSFIFNNSPNYTQFWDNNSLSSGLTPWHIPWLNASKEKYGDKFLGIYLYDEPGGNQVDGGYWGGNNQTFTGRIITTFANTTSYDDAANKFNSSLSRSPSMQAAKNLTLPIFTSDYALQWFDYLAGYNVVLTQLGQNRGNNSKIQQIALCRGAANVQNKQWGAIVTWTYDSPPYYENGTLMLQDMNMAYQAGANYLVVFNYPQINPFGALTEEHFKAMKDFWSQIHSSPRNLGSNVKGQVALVLPKNYGWGMRTPEDKIWGLWSADNSSAVVWDKMTVLIDKYGTRLDIVYDDASFSFQQNYSEIYYWNSTTN